MFTHSVAIVVTEKLHDSTVPHIRFPIPPARHGANAGVCEAEIGSLNVTDQERLINVSSTAASSAASGAGGAEILCPANLQGVLIAPVRKRLSNQIAQMRRGVHVAVVAVEFDELSIDERLGGQVSEAPARGLVAKAKHRARNHGDGRNVFAECWHKRARGLHGAVESIGHVRRKRLRLYHRLQAQTCKHIEVQLLLKDPTLTMWNLSLSLKCSSMRLSLAT